MAVAALHNQAPSFKQIYQSRSHPGPRPRNLLPNWETPMSFTIPNLLTTILLSVPLLLSIAPSVHASPTSYSTAYSAACSSHPVSYNLLVCFAIDRVSDAATHASFMAAVPALSYILRHNGTTDSPGAVKFFVVDENHRSHGYIVSDEAEEKRSGSGSSRKNDGQGDGYAHGYAHAHGDARSKTGSYYHISSYKHTHHDHNHDDVNSILNRMQENTPLLRPNVDKKQYYSSASHSYSSTSHKKTHKHNPLLAIHSCDALLRSHMSPTHPSSNHTHSVIVSLSSRFTSKRDVTRLLRNGRWLFAVQERVHFHTLTRKPSRVVKRLDAFRMLDFKGESRTSYFRSSPAMKARKRAWVAVGRYVAWYVRKLAAKKEKDGCVTKSRDDKSIPEVPDGKSKTPFVSPYKPTTSSAMNSLTPPPPSASPSKSGSSSPTPSTTRQPPSVTPPVSPSYSATSSPTASSTPAPPSVTPSVSPSKTGTSSPTPSSTPPPQSKTPSVSPSMSRTSIPTPSSTPLPPSPTPSVSPSNSGTSKPTPSSTPPQPSMSPSISTTATTTPSSNPTAPSMTPSNSGTSTPTPSSTPLPLSKTPSASPSISATPTPTPSSTPPPPSMSPTISSTSTPTPSSTPPPPSVTPSASASLSSSSTPSATPSQSSVTPSPSISQTQSMSPSTSAQVIPPILSTPEVEDPTGFNPRPIGNDKGVTPRQVSELPIPRRTDTESTNDLVEQLQRTPFAPPRLRSVDEITFDENGSLVENAVNLRDAIEFLIFKELGGTFFNETSDPLMKSAVTIIDHSYFPARYSLGSVRKAELIENSCESNRCAAKVLVRSSTITKEKAVKRALDLLTKRLAFRPIFNPKPWTRKVERIRKGEARYWQITQKYNIKNSTDRR